MCSPGVQAQGNRLFTAFADQGSTKAKALLNDPTMRVLLGRRGEAQPSSSARAEPMSQEKTYDEVPMTRGGRRGAQRRSFFTRG